MGEWPRLGASVGGYALVEEEPAKPKQVRFATLQSFKGMEADVVLLVDVDLDHKASSPQNLYVGFSRAKHRLFVWVPEGQVARMMAAATPQTAPRVA